MYPGAKWEKKVARMSDNQVLAIYYSKNERKKKAEAERCIKEQAEPAKEIHIGFEQLTFEDIMTRDMKGK